MRVLAERGKAIEHLKEWREHQADYFASAIAMPKATFVPLVPETLKANGINEEYCN